MDALEPDMETRLAQIRVYVVGMVVLVNQLHHELVHLVRLRRQVLCAANEHRDRSIAADFVDVLVDSLRNPLDEPLAQGTCISSSARLSAYLWLIASYSSLAVAVTCKELSFQRIAYVSAYESVLPSMRSNVGASRYEILEVRPVAAHECDCVHDMRLLSVEFTYTIPRECRSASLVMPNGKGSSRERPSR